VYKLYGIKNCDTVRKALRALDANKTEYEFIDFKKQVPTAGQIKAWKKELADWPVNRKGRTFKQFQEEFDAATPAEKIALIQDHTSMIKRPLLEKASKIICAGFDESIYSSL